MSEEARLKQLLSQRATRISILEEEIATLMENNNRQGCRWTKASDDNFPKQFGLIHFRDFKTKNPITAGTAYTLIRRKDFDFEWLDESIEPCATSSDAREEKIVWLKEELQKVQEEFDLSQNVISIQEEEIKELKKGNERQEAELCRLEMIWETERGDNNRLKKENERLKQTLSPTSDRDCEELKKGNDELRKEIEILEEREVLWANKKNQLEDRISVLEEGLKELIAVKYYKDTYGKDGHYNIIQPKAWEKAKQLLNKHP